MHCIINGRTFAQRSRFTLIDSDDSYSQIGKNI